MSQDNDSRQSIDSDTPEPPEMSQHVEPPSAVSPGFSMTLKRLGFPLAGQMKQWSGDDLADTDRLVRIAALQALGDAEDPLPIEPLLTALQNSEWSVRALAALMLRRAEAQQVPFTPLLEAQHDADEAVRAAATRTLGGLGTRVPLKALEAALHDPAWVVREAAALSLGEIGSKAAVALLRTALHDADSTVREAAHLALQQAERQALTPIPASAAQTSASKPLLSRRTLLVGLGAAALAGSSVSLALLLSNRRPEHQAGQAATQPGLKSLALEGPGYSSFDALGNLYLMDATLQNTRSRILKLSPSGLLLNKWQRFPIDTPPTCAAVDGQGNLFVIFQGCQSHLQAVCTRKCPLRVACPGPDARGNHH